MAKKRLTKEEKALEKRIDVACQNATLGLSIGVMNLGKIYVAAQAAAAAGEDVEAAALAKAKELHEAR